MSFNTFSAGLVKVQPADFYVAVNGSDTWSGKLAAPNPAGTDGPFATLERARDGIRKMKAALPSAGITVEMRGGLYERSRTFELTAEDSGTATAPVVYRARKGEPVRLTGGKMVTGWKPVTDPKVLARLDTNAQAHVVQADLKAQGITDYGTMESASTFAQSDAGMELFFDEKPMTPARWPNQGYMHIKDLVVNDGWNIRTVEGSKVGHFVYEEDRPARWVNDKDIMVHGYWFWDWADQRYKVGKIDAKKRQMTLAKPADHPFGYRKGQWFYAYNLLCELDKPGEWYLDRESGILYFWPPSPVGKGTTAVSLLSNLVTMEDVSWVTLSGLTLECGQGTAVSMTGGTGNHVESCTIRNMGKSGVTITGGTGHGIVGCDICQLGDGAVSMTGGDRMTLTPGGHFADNNHIHHCSRWNPLYHPGIQVSGAGQSVTHNLIDNLPHVAIGFTGNDHRIEYNEIHSCVYQANDAGAIYTVGPAEEWTMRGHRIRFNYLHDLYGFEGRGCNGVYLDDAFSSAEIAHNIFHKVATGVLIGGGRDSIIENNAFIDCPKAFSIDARGLGWMADMEKELTDQLKEFPYQDPLWRNRYPKLVNILEDEPMKPKGNEVIRNISWGGEWGWTEECAKPCVLFKDNLIDVDPMFTDSKRQDFRLRSSSPALALGFQPIPVEKMGLYADALRATWPVSRSVRPAQPPCPADNVNEED